MIEEVYWGNQESCNNAINVQFVFETKDLTKDEKEFFS